MRPGEGKLIYSCYNVSDNENLLTCSTISNATINGSDQDCLLKYKTSVKTRLELYTHSDYELNRHTGSVVLSTNLKKNDCPLKRFGKMLKFLLWTK